MRRLAFLVASLVYYEIGTASALWLAGEGFSLPGVGPMSLIWAAMSALVLVAVTRAQFLVFEAKNRVPRPYGFMGVEAIVIVLGFLGLVGSILFADFWVGPKMETIAFGFPFWVPQFKVAATLLVLPLVLGPSTERLWKRVPQGTTLRQAS